MSKKNSLSTILGPDRTVTAPRRTSHVGATLLGALAGIMSSAIVLAIAYPILKPATVPSPTPETPTESMAPQLLESQKKPTPDAVARAQNTVVDFYRNTKQNVLAPEDRVAIGVAVTSDGWVAVGEDAFALAPADVVAVARGTEGVIEKKITDPFSHITFVKIKRDDLQVVPFAESALPAGSSITEFSKAGGLSFGFLTTARRHLGSTPTGSETLDVSVETTTPRAVGAILFAADGSLLGIVGKKDIATPGTIIREATKLLLKKGAFTRPKLLLTTLDLSAVVVRKKTLPSDGALITKKGSAPALVKKSAADIAGLKEGDVIVKVDSIQLNSDHTLAEALSLYNTGTTIPLTVMRGGAAVQIAVSL